MTLLEGLLAILTLPQLGISYLVDLNAVTIETHKVISNITQ